MIHKSSQLFFPNIRKLGTSSPSVTMHSKQNLWYKIDDMFINKEYTLLINVSEEHELFVFFYLTT